MAESTLSGTWDDIRAAVGYDRGYGRKSANWSEKQLDAINDALKVGTRWMVSTPPVQLGSGLTVTSYRWSWMEPVQGITVWPTQSPASGATITPAAGSDVVTSSGSTFYDSMVGKQLFAYTNDSSQTLVGNVGTIQSVLNGTTLKLDAYAAYTSGPYRWGITSDGSYRLPDDFGGMNSHELTFATGLSATAVKLIPEATVRDAYQTSTATGRPRWAAIRTDYETGSTTTRFYLFLFPLPDQVYTLSVPYIRLIDAMSTALVWPLGGMPYFEAFKDAAMAAAELSVDDAKGPRWDQFMTSLRSAIEYDLVANRVKTIGKNRDQSRAAITENPHLRRTDTIIYNGIQT